MILVFPGEQDPFRTMISASPNSRHSAPFSTSSIISRIFPIYGKNILRAADTRAGVVHPGRGRSPPGVMIYNRQFRVIRTNPSGNGTCFPKASGRTSFLDIHPGTGGGTAGQDGGRVIPSQ